MKTLSALLLVLPFTLAATGPPPDPATSGTSPVAPSMPPDNVGKPIGGNDAAGFAHLDTDHDGRISQTEAKASTELATRFAQLDADGDGSLSAKEYAAYGREAPR